MKKQLLFISLIFFLVTSVNAQVVINEFETTGMDRIELKNQGATMVDVSTYVLCDFPQYQPISSLMTVSGSKQIPPGGFVVLTGFPLDDADSELGLYLNSSNFADPANIVDYVEWGSSGHTRSSVAVSAGTWTAGNFVMAPPANTSMEYDGTGDSQQDWFIQQAPTFGSENGVIISIEETESNQISLFPSLVKDFIKLDLSGTVNQFNSIEIVSVNGQIILQQAISNNKIIDLDVSSLKAGNYFVRILGEKTISEKIVKE